MQKSGNGIKIVWRSAPIVRVSPFSFTRPIQTKSNLCCCSGRNQKQRLRALEQAAEQSSKKTITSSMTDPRVSVASDPPHDDQIWNLSVHDNLQSSLSYLQTDILDKVIQ